MAEQAPPTLRRLKPRIARPEGGNGNITGETPSVSRQRALYIVVLAGGLGFDVMALVIGGIRTVARRHDDSSSGVRPDGGEPQNEPAFRLCP